MKCIYFPIVLIGLCLIVFAFSVPIDEQQNQLGTGKKVKQISRQVVNNNPGGNVPQITTSDDDDDDDDDGDGGFEEVLDGDDGEDEDDDDEDDDDDDDDDEEDDEGDDEGEDGDYLERFFDDILGDDDDDDYDNDESGEIASVNNVTSIINAPKPEAVATPIQPENTFNEIVDVSSNSNVNIADPIEIAADEIVAVPEIIQQEEIITKAPVYELSISQDEEIDEDDDDFADGVIEARSLHRASKQNKDSNKNPALPSSILANYNNVVDGVYDKLNRILKKMYDPINVQLTKQNKRSESKNLKKKRNHSDARKSVLINSSNVKSKQVNIPTAGTTSKPTTTKAKTRARGTMYGLSTLKRKGNIQVASENGEDTIKSDFVLGPLMLKVSKSFSRGAKRELRSASAMTSKLRGRIILKVNDGRALLHTIKIQQPKNIKIEVPGKKLNKSRQMAWRNGINIAHIVADQLSTVSRTVLNL